jgi:hypothetical protein
MLYSRGGEICASTFGTAPSKNRFQSGYQRQCPGSPTMPRSCFTLGCFTLSGQKFRSARGVKAAHSAPKGFSLDAAGAGRSTMAARGKQHQRFHRLFRSRTFSRSGFSRSKRLLLFSVARPRAELPSRGISICRSAGGVPLPRFPPYGRACVVCRQKSIARDSCTWNRRIAGKWKC